MNVIDSLETWGQSVVLLLACISWVVLFDRVFLGVITGEPHLGAVYQVVVIGSWVVMVTALFHEIWQTATDLDMWHTVSD